MQSASAIVLGLLLLFCHLKNRIQIKLHGLKRVLRVKISKSNFMSYRSKWQLSSSLELVSCRKSSFILVRLVRFHMLRDNLLLMRIRITKYSLFIQLSILEI